MIVRSSKFLLLFVAATLVGATLFALAAVWQLSRGPISLGFLTPYIEESLSGGPNDVQVRLHDTVLTWAGLERTLDLRAVGLEVVDRDGEVSASVPEMSVQLSLRALLRGLVAPTTLELFGPRLRVVRTADGEIVIGIGAVTGRGASDGDAMGLIAGLLREPDPGTETGYLRRVSVVSALIEFEDRQRGRSWTAQRADVSLARNVNGIQADGTITVDAGGNFARFAVSGLFDRLNERVELGLSFGELMPHVMASLDPKLDPLERLRLPLSGTLALSLSPSLAIENLSFDVTGGAGEIVIRELYQEPLRVSELALRGRATDGLRSLVIDEATANLGGPQLALAGEAVRDGDAISVRLGARAQTVPVDDLARLWPAEVGANARAWITKNITGGTINDATFTVAADIRASDPGAMEWREATGQFDVSGASVHYLRPMTPAGNVSAVGRFDGANLVIDVGQGGVNGLAVEAGEVSIRGITGPAEVERVHIDLTIAGPARDALELLDQEPLKFISGFGIDPAKTSGVQRANVVFEFPLLDALAVEDVDAAASVRLENFASTAGVFGADLTQGDFDLAVTTDKMVAKGRGVLAGVPIDLTWTENFAASATLQTRYEVQAVLDEDARQTLGLTAQPVLRGPVGVGLTYEISADGAEKGAASLNLADATMSLTDFGWDKAPGVPGAATVEFSSRGGSPTEISRFTVAAPDLSAVGRAVLAKSGDGLAVSSIEFARLTLGETDVALRVAFGEDGVPDVTIGGETLDLRSVIDDAFAESGDSPPAMRVRFDPDNVLTRIRLGEQTSLLNPTGRLFHNGEDWAEVDLLGKLSNGAVIDLQLQTIDDRREVLIVSDDGGAVLRALDWVNTIEGGALRVEGAFTGSGADEKFAGQFALSDFKLNEGPVMARILSLASFSGIADALAGTGITFRRAEIPFELTDSEIIIGKAKARGADIGILATGRIDRPTDVIDLKGEIAPAYTLNSIFSNIPIIGPVLTGGGDAIFAATYSVKGPIDDPSVSVNPLTVLTPGILRRLVTGFGSGEGPENGSTAPPEPLPQAE